MSPVTNALLGILFLILAAATTILMLHVRGR
jgi:hypothetical protein